MTKQCIKDRFLAVFTVSALAFPFLWLASGAELDAGYRLIALLFGVALALRWIPIRQDPLVLLALIFPLFLVVAHLWQSHTISEDIFGGSHARQYWISFFFFIPIAYATTIWQRISPFVILGSAAAGLVFFLVLHAPSSDWTHAWAGQRVAYGFPNAQHSGVVFGAGLLAMIVFLPRSIGLPLRSRAVGLPLLLAFGALMLWGVVTTQVRAVWLGLLVAAVVTAVLWAFQRAGQRSRLDRRSFSMLLITCVIVVLGALSFDAPNRVIKRIATEQISLETISGAIRFEPGSYHSSATVRLASWSASLEWIAERPLLGWGGRTAKRLIRLDDRFDEWFKQHFGHLHNSYLEVLVAIGFVGASLLVALIYLVARQVILARRTGRMPLDVFIFAWAFFAYWCVVNFFESYAYMRVGFLLNTVFGAFVLANCLRAGATLLANREQIKA